MLVYTYTYDMYLYICILQSQLLPIGHLHMCIPIYYVVVLVFKTHGKALFLSHKLQINMFSQKGHVMKKISSHMHFPNISLLQFSLSFNIAISPPPPPPPPPNATRFRPPPNTSRPGQPSWVRHIKGRREMWEKRKKEEAEHIQYLSSLEAKRAYPSAVIDALRFMDVDTINMNLLLELVKEICHNRGPGAILVFLPGWDTISKLHDMLRADPVLRSSKFLIIPLHSLMPTSFQQSVGCIHSTYCTSAY